VDGWQMKVQSDVSRCQEKISRTHAVVIMTRVIHTLNDSMAGKVVLRTKF